MLPFIPSHSHFPFTTTFHPSQTKELSDQLILVNHSDLQIGSISKLNAHLQKNKNKHPHRAFSVFLFNSQNDLLIQQRSAKKITFPLQWSNTCCSHPLNIPSEKVTHNNKGILTAVTRRVHFELGIPTSLTQYTLYNKILYKSTSDKTFEEYELDYLFLIKLFTRNDLPSLKRNINTNEVKDINFVQMNALLNDMKRNACKYTPWFRFIMNTKGKEMFKLMASSTARREYKYNNEIINFL
jgi:isopentenyl-diphosphate delta-isomerase